MIKIFPAAVGADYCMQPGIKAAVQQRVEGTERHGCDHFSSEVIKDQQITG